jgi:hypothetical protein
MPLGPVVMPHRLGPARWRKALPMPISAGGGPRIHFEPQGTGPEPVALLTAVGTHSQLYG